MRAILADTDIRTSQRGPCDIKNVFCHRREARRDDRTGQSQRRRAPGFRGPGPEAEKTKTAFERGEPTRPKRTANSRPASP